MSPTSTATGTICDEHVKFSWDGGAAVALGPRRSPGVQWWRSALVRISTVSRWCPGGNRASCTSTTATAVARGAISPRLGVTWMFCPSKTAFQAKLAFPGLVRLSWMSGQKVLLGPMEQFQAALGGRWASCPVAPTPSVTVAIRRSHVYPSMAGYMNATPSPRHDTVSWVSSTSRSS